MAPSSSVQFPKASNTSRGFAIPGHGDSQNHALSCVDLVFADLAKDCSKVLLQIAPIFEQFTVANDENANDIKNDFGNGEGRDL